RNNDRALSNLESVPGGYAQIRRMYQSFQGPLAQASEGGPQFSMDELNRRRARAMGVTRPDTANVNTTPLPNPWARRRPWTAARPGLDARGPLAMADQVSRNADRLAQLDISTTRQGRQRPADDLLALLAQGGFGGPRVPTAPRSRVHTAGHAASRPPTVPSARPSARPSAGSGSQQPAAAAPADGAQRRDPAQYHDMLEQLEEMGFVDRDKNLQALIATDGDLDQAINIIAGEDGG
ncbi:hypothetical protein H4R21_004175, partial [Coemansia helicoidea]